MAKLRSLSTNGKKKGVGIVNLVEKLQKSFGRSNKLKLMEEVKYGKVPSDVKEGHFAVVAVESSEAKRFVVPLSYLAHPRFKRLLEQAADEYGFNQEGALAIPCGPYEIERILADHKWPTHSHSSSSSSSSSSSRVGVDKSSWDSCNSTFQIC